MSEPLVTFKKSKTKRTQRTREIDAETATAPTEDANAGTREDSPGILASKLKSKLKSRNKPQSKLSFGGPDEVRSVSEASEHLLSLV